MPTGRRLTEAQVKEVRELLGVGITIKAIAKKMGVSESPIGRIKRNPRFKGAPATDPQAHVTSETKAEAETATPPPETKPAPGRGPYVHLEPEIMKLKAEGLGVKGVAARLGIPPTTVNYYFYGKRKHPAKKKPSQARNVKSSEMESTNGHHQLDSRFLVGFACAELERTLTAIAERLSIAPNLLRQGFSKFLGSAPVR